MRKYTLFALIVALIFLFVPIQAGASSLATARDPSVKTITRTAMSLPATTQTSVFKIAGAPIEILSLTGEVTTVIGTTTTSITLRADPTTPATDTDLMTGQNIGDDAVGTMYSLVTSVGTAMAVYTNGIGPTMGGVFSIIAPIGNIDLETAATVTGAITWRMTYRPWPGAKVTAE